MNKKIVYEKVIKYLGKLLKMQPLKTSKEIKEVKELREQLNSMMYEKETIRSKNANSYLWYLCTQIANKMRLSKDEVYLNMLKSYGQVMMIPVIKGAKPYGYFKYYEYQTTSILNGKEADWYKVYKGSSHFTKKEMSILLDGVIQEANQLEIPTISDEQVEKMKGSWNSNEEENI